MSVSGRGGLDRHLEGQKKNVPPVQLLSFRSGVNAPVWETL
jgi:hypothetical protein